MMFDLNENHSITKEKFLHDIRNSFTTRNGEKIPVDALEKLYENYKDSCFVDYEDFLNRTCVCESFEDYVLWCKECNRVMPLGMTESKMVLDKANGFGEPAFFEMDDLNLAKKRFKFIAEFFDCFIHSEEPFIICVAPEKILQSDAIENEKIDVRILQIVEKINAALRLDSLNKESGTLEHLVLRRNFIPNSKQIDEKFEKQLEQLKQLQKGSERNLSHELSYLFIVVLVLLLVNIGLLVAILMTLQK